MKSAFPAKKALAESRRLGIERIGRAMQLLAQADLDIRGVSGLSGETVLEILVARLSRLCRSRPLGGRSWVQEATASRDCSPASATFSVQWKPSQ